MSHVQLSSSVYLSVCLFALLRMWDFPAGLVAETPRFLCRGPGFDPWSRNSYAASKILRATTKTCYSQVNKYFFKMWS